MGCRRWGCNEWRLKGCLAALPGIGLFRPFLPFSPFFGGCEEHPRNPENGGKRTFFPVISSDPTLASRRDSNSLAIWASKVEKHCSDKSCSVERAPDGCKQETTAGTTGEDREDHQTTLKLSMENTNCENAPDGPTLWFPSLVDKLLFSTWLFAIFTHKRSFAFFSALLRPFALFCGLAFALFCAHPANDRV